MPVFLFPILALVLCRRSAVGAAACVDQECREVTESQYELYCSNYNVDSAPVATLIPSPPPCPIRNCSLTSNQSIPLSENIPTTLTLEFMHASLQKFVVKVKWELPQTMDNVTGYTLLASDSPLDSSEDIKYGLGDSCSKQCVSLPESAREYSFTHFYSMHSLENGRGYIKLISHPYCEESAVTTSYSVPRDCHFVQPGDCSICGYHVPPRPRNVNAVPSLMAAGNVCVYISWELEAVYLNPYPNKVFYLRITDEDGSSTVLEVVGRNNATVCKLDPQQTYSVKVKLSDCGCSFNSKEATFQLASSSLPLPPLTPTPLQPLITLPHPPLTPTPLQPLIPTSMIPLPTTLLYNWIPSSTEAASLHYSQGITIIAVVSLVTLLLLTAVCCTAVYLSQSLWPRYRQPIKEYTHSQALDKSVVMVYSERSTESDKYHIRYLAHQLECSGAQVRMQDTENVRGSVATWLEEAIKQSCAVLCVCNREFHEEWEEGRQRGQSLIHPLKQLVEGDVCYDDDSGMSKYVVILLKSEHNKYIPRYLKNRKCLVSAQSTASDLILHITGSPRILIQ